MKYGTYAWALSGKKVISCESRMKLWYNVNAMAIEVPRSGYGQKYRLTKEEQKQIIKDFPESTNGCRCRDCRYHRLVNK